ncbi:GNAT family N-acetyltransferase [Paenibacillus gansuensis]|uniref:GNAT family N-acetyltransferase n=1 Tax=Paenibacillus gansuensis TaxID=306542 RepID=A0ABW5P811_9BACL
MVQLAPMNESQYARFRERSLRDFAADKVKIGAWSEDEVPKLAEAAFLRFLPEEADTPGAHFLAVIDENQSLHVGEIWLQISESPAGTSAFLYDIVIYEAFQGQGYGKQTMAALDDTARGLGARSISLHVFGFNERARHLYEKSGYIITDYHMTKELN